MRTRIFLSLVLASVLLDSNVALAMDSTHGPVGNLASGTSHSFVLATGTSPFVRGNDQFLGTTEKQCPSGSSPKVVTSLNDAGTSSSDTFCPLATIHARDSYTKENDKGGYNVFVGYSNVATGIVCSDRGVSLNWTVYCLINPKV